jgi:hypothetical protein
MIYHPPQLILKNVCEGTGVWVKPGIRGNTLIQKK